jgi:uncharacterized membrane protein YesL
MCLAKFRNPFDFESSGVGISKNAPKKKRVFVFFDIFFNKFWKLLWLNVIYMVFCLPIVTIGPATAGVTKVLRNFSQQRPVFLWGDFIESFRKNMKQGLLMGLIDVFVFASTALAFYIYPLQVENTGNKIWYVPFITTVAISITVFIMSGYAYLMIVTTSLSFKNILKNSFYLTCVCAKQSLITFLICVAIVTVAIFLFVTNEFARMCIIFAPATMIGLVVCFNFYPIIQKFVINPYYEQTGEENPEDRYKPSSSEETIFVDRGGEETPIEKKSKAKNTATSKATKRKGRTIS